MIMGELLYTYKQKFFSMQGQFSANTLLLGTKFYSPLV